MTGSRGARPLAKPMVGADTSDSGQASSSEDQFNIEQIEYLLFQSTQGVHFMFDNAEIARVMSVPTDAERFFTVENMQKVQGLLSELLGKKTLSNKSDYLEALPRADFELLVRAYFHLVENTILSHSTLRH